MKKKKQKEMEQLQEREGLTIQINKYGGLWTNHRDVKQVLDTLNGAEEKRLALKIQLNFRSKVLTTKCDKSLFYMSSGGKLKSVDEIAKHLVKIITWASNGTT